MIDEVKKFIDEFLETEYKTTILYYTEKDQNIYTENYNKLKSFYEIYVNPEISSRKNIDNALSHSESTSKIIKRICFQIKEYDNEEYGKIYRCYISYNYNGVDENDRLKYWQNYFAAKVAGQYKIVSNYILKKRIDEIKKLSSDLNKSWYHIDGDKFIDIGKPTSVLKIQSPTHPLEIAEYNAE